MTFTHLALLMAFLIGLIVGLTISFFTDRKDAIGTLIVVYDNEDPTEKPYVWLSINENCVGEIRPHTQIVLDVISNSERK